MTLKEFRKIHKPVRCFFKYTSECRTDRVASHRLGHRQRAAIGEFYYTTPFIVDRAFSTAKSAKIAAHRVIVKNALLRNENILDIVLVDYLDLKNKNGN